MQREKARAASGYADGAELVDEGLICVVVVVEPSGAT
jgi:hypothetical protein